MLSKAGSPYLTSMTLNWQCSSEQQFHRSKGHTSLENERSWRFRCDLYFVITIYKHFTRHCRCHFSLFTWPHYCHWYWMQAYNLESFLEYSSKSFVQLAGIYGSEKYIHSNILHGSEPYGSLLLLYLCDEWDHAFGNHCLLCCNSHFRWFYTPFVTFAIEDSNSHYLFNMGRRTVY